MNGLSETDLVAALGHVGIFLSPAQLEGLQPGVAIMQSLIERVNTPLPFDAEPAVTFNPDRQR